MLGNAKGWIISALFIAATAFFFVSSGILQVPPVSQPSGKINFSEKIALPGDPQPYVTAPTAGRDAGEVYRLAINEYENNEKLYAADGKYAKTPLALADDDPKGVQLIVEAANCNGSDLFASRPDTVVHYNTNWPDLDGLFRLGVLTNNAGAIYITRKDYDKAEKHIRAGFMLGYRLYNERIVWQELNHGINLMIDASLRMSKLYTAQGETEKALVASKFSVDLATYKREQLFQRIARYLNSINTQEIGERGGDFFYLVRQSPERVWRVEALLALGRMKYNTSNRGDQVAAKREVKRYLSDPDAAVQIAAKLADELTIERYRMLGG